MHTDTSSPRQPRGIQSIETGYRILTAIQQGPGAVALKDVAARADVAPSAAHNYLASFVRTGMVKSDGRGMYRLGPSLAALGMTALRDVDHFDLIRDAAIGLSAETGLGTAVVTWSHGPVILFNQAAVRDRVFDLRNGPVDMLHTGAGHVFVAHLPLADTLQVAARETGRPAAECEPMLEEIRRAVCEHGHAVVPLRGIPGYLGISVPVWNGASEVAYGLTLTAPRDMLDARPDSVQIRALKRRGRELSRLFGAPPRFWAD